MPTVGQRLKELRKLLDLTVDEFANIFGLHRSSVYRYENDERELPMDLAIQIAKRFNVSLDWLAGESDVMEKNITYKDNDELTNIINKLSPEAQKEILRYANYIQTKEDING